MQISPIPTLDDETNQIRLMTADIVANHIIPNEHFLRQRCRCRMRTSCQLVYPSDGRAELVV